METSMQEQENGGKDSSRGRRKLRQKFQKQKGKEGRLKIFRRNRRGRNIK